MMNENDTQSETNAETAPEMNPDAATPGSATTSGADSGADADTEAPEGAAADTTPEARILELEGELAVARDRQLRLAAEMENTRKRAEKEVRDTREYAVSRFAGDMLAVADNLARALEAARKGEEADSAEAIKSMIEGVSMTERALLSTLERHGVVKIDPQPGEPFDPNRHQAVAQIPSEHPQGRIASVMQTGFVIGQRPLRAAMVAVSSGQAGGGETGAETGAETGGETGGGGGSASGGTVDIKA